MSGFTDHTGHFHGFHQSGRPVVADLELALHRGNGGAPRLQYKSHRLVVEGILLGIVATTAATVEARQAGITTTLEDFLQIVRLTTLAPVITHPVHFLV